MSFHFNRFNFNYENEPVGQGNGRGHYDQYGNFIPNERPNMFTQYILQTVSDTVRSALNNLSNQIESHLMGNIDNDVEFYNPNLQPQQRPQYIVIRYKNMPNKKDHTSCPICFDDYDDSSMVLSTECLHFFHEECLKKWAALNKTCPICRTDI